MIYLALGVLVLVVGLWLLRSFAEADPARLVRGAARFGIAIAAVLAVLLLFVLLVTGRLGLVLAELGGIAPLALRGWMLWRRRQPAAGPAPGRVSEVETDYLRMRLDHDSGTMSGTVRRGPFHGRRLDELARAELLALWRECRAEDEQAANLLEAYFDRSMPGWREAAQDSGGGGGGASRAADAMSREEAYAVLGLAPGAGTAEIRDAHRRLMMKLHPDQGGSDYLAAKLNRAREVLLEG